jgi:hypothetical protein
MMIGVQKHESKHNTFILRRRRQCFQRRPHQSVDSRHAMAANNHGTMHHSHATVHPVHA